MIVADMQAYLVPGWPDGVPLQWVGPGDGRLTKVLSQKCRSGWEDRCQGVVIRVDFESDGSLEWRWSVMVKSKFSEYPPARPS